MIIVAVPKRCAQRIGALIEKASGNLLIQFQFGNMPDICLDRENMNVRRKSRAEPAATIR